MAHRWYKKQSPGIKILALLSDWSIRDSNPWPPQCECGALPAALIPHNGNNGARTHDLPLVRRALSQLSYVSVLFFGSSVFLSSLQHGMPDAASGPGGNRTRVQKSVPCTSTIIVRSFRFPLPHGNEHPCGVSSFMIRPVAQSFASVVSHMFDAGFPTCECIGSDMRQLGRS